MGEPLSELQCDFFYWFNIQFVGIYFNSFHFNTLSRFYNKNQWVGPFDAEMSFVAKYS